VTPDSGTEARKRAAAAGAVSLIKSGMVLGLGTGSTVRPLLEMIAARLESGSLSGILGVPTSEDTASRSRALGIPLVTLDEQPRVDLAIDGADEIDPRLNLIKGLGGALLREKLVACAARRFVIVADEGKLVRRLGTRAPLPVEVVPFGWTTHLAFLRKLGARPELRRKGDGTPVVTDSGNYLVDCRFPRGIPSPAALSRTLAARPGMVEHGLFLGMADRAIVAGVSGLTVLRRRSSRRR
jgi:ribose 5-phosphate isomerase A